MEEKEKEESNPVLEEKQKEKVKIIEKIKLIKKIKLTPLISILLGVILGIIIMIVLNLFGISFEIKTVAKANGKIITEETLYNQMKQYYSLNFVLEDADKAILNDLYTLDEDQQEEVEDEAEYYLSLYETYYGYTEEQFYSENGFSNKDDFIEYLGLDYKRNLYIEDYIKSLISDEEINGYYENNVYGKINSKRILVEITDDVTEDKALTLAQEIIGKLNKGTTFDEIKTEYGDKITYEEVGYMGFNSDMEDAYMEALKGLQDGAYTPEPIKTSEGYNIIYRIDQEEKEALEDVKEDIISILADEMESDDSNISYKALIKMREDYGFIIKDETIKNQYEEYCAQFEETTDDDTATNETTDNTVNATDNTTTNLTVE